MKAMPGWIVKLYSFLLNLYPASFQTDFKEQMLLDFEDLANDVRQHGKGPLLIFVLHELADLPGSLLHAHWQDGTMPRLLRSEPVNFGLRGAIGFGVGFAAAAVAITVFSGWLLSAFDYQISRFSVWIYDTFRNEDGTLMLWRGVSLLSSALTGFVFGSLFAFLAGHRVKYARYVMAGTLAWFIPVAVSVILSDGFEWSVFLSPAQSSILGIAISMLCGAFLGAIFYIAEGSSWKSVKLLAWGGIAGPLAVYVLIKILFYTRLETTVGLFPALIGFMAILLASCFALAKIGRNTIPWGVILGAIVYPILDRLTYYLAYTVLHIPSAPIGEGITPEVFAIYQMNWTGVQAVFGILFGLMLGIFIGLQNRAQRPKLSSVH